jgi:hypothetical protein
MCCSGRVKGMGHTSEKTSNDFFGIELQERFKARVWLALTSQLAGPIIFQSTMANTFGGTVIF